MKIEVIKEDGSRRNYNITSGQVTAGRDANNTISVQDIKVSRRHLTLFEDQGVIRIQDLGSTNGTYINNKRIASNRIYNISSQTNIRIGNTMLILDPSNISVNRTEVIQGQNNYPGVVDNRPPQYSPQQQNVNQYEPHRGLGNEIQYGLHATKSFVGPAWLTFFLYYIGLFLGGLIANILFLNSARTTQRIINRDPPGLGCLWFLIWTHVFIPLILVAIFLLLLAFGVVNIL